MPRSYPGSTLGIDPRSQGVIPGRFKRKKNFVMDRWTNVWTDRRDSQNSDVDETDLQLLLATEGDFMLIPFNILGGHP